MGTHHDQIGPDFGGDTKDFGISVNTPSYHFLNVNTLYPGRLFPKNLLRDRFGPAVDIRKFGEMELRIVRVVLKGNPYMKKCQTGSKENGQGKGVGKSIFRSFGKIGRVKD